MAEPSTALTPILDNNSPIQCGKDAARYFAFADGYKNMNHGSFGTYPTPIRHTLRSYQDLAEARPDDWIRWTHPKHLDTARSAIASYLSAPVDTCVFVVNATTALNLVLRNLIFKPGDVIIYFATIYGACEKTISYITETTPATSHRIDLQFPMSDATVCQLFENAITSTKATGRTPRIAIFDTIVSMPGIRLPFTQLTQLCAKHGVLSCIDGAHGVGHIPLNLSELDPDFFFSNCHKWLYTPRGSAVMYVPERNQGLMRSTLPTSHAFVPLPAEDGDGKGIVNPLPKSEKSHFVYSFEYTGTQDSNPFLCVPDALAFRGRVTWEGKRGEEAVFGYMRWLAREGGRVVAEDLGTEVLENEEGTLGECCFVNVRLPLSYERMAGGDRARAIAIAEWMIKVINDEYGTFLALMVYGEAWWVRLSAQIYLTVEDFAWSGTVLREVCERARKGEWMARSDAKL